MGWLIEAPSGTTTTPTAPESDASTTRAWVISQLIGAIGPLGTEVPVPGTSVVVVVPSGIVVTGTVVTGTVVTGTVVAVPVVAVPPGTMVTGTVVPVGGPGVLVGMVVSVPIAGDDRGPEPEAEAEPEPDATGASSTGASDHKAVKARTVTPLAERVNNGLSVASASEP